MNPVEAVFTRTATTYDVNRTRLIPGYDEFYAAAVALLPPHTSHVLDLGAGTGLMAAWVRERFPDAYLHLIDNSAPMLAQAKQRFEQDQQVLCQQGDYTTCAWGSSYDAIVSALSIHHLADEAKQQLFVQVLAALKPGGVFVNAEQIAQPTAMLEHAAQQDWMTDVRALGASEEQISASLLRQTEDRCATVEAQLAWLLQAGFADAGCTWQLGRFAVLAAWRAS